PSRSPNFPFYPFDPRPPRSGAGRQLRAMAQDYYTLEEAARIVSLSPDELKQMARRGELRAFQDRGTWRFRAQDIQELARRRGMTSDPELVLGEAHTPRPADSPAPRGPAPKTREAEVFGFTLGGEDESTGVGQEEFSLEAPGSSRKQEKPSSKRLKEGPRSPAREGPRSPTKEGPRSPVSKEGPRSPAPKPGSDSDVRLVPDASDSDSRLTDEPPSGQAKQRPQSRPGAGPQPPAPRGKASSKVEVGQKSGLHPPGPVDSGARLLPMESDSDVRLTGTGDESPGPGADAPRSAAGRG